MTTTVHTLFIFAVFFLVAFLDKNISVADSVENNGELENVTVEEEEIRGEEDEPERVKRTIVNPYIFGGHPRYIQQDEDEIERKRLQQKKNFEDYKNRGNSEPPTQQQLPNPNKDKSDEQKNPGDDYVGEKQGLYSVLEEHKTHTFESNFSTHTKETYEKMKGRSAHLTNEDLWNQIDEGESLRRLKERLMQEGDSIAQHLRQEERDRLIKLANDEKWLQHLKEIEDQIREEENKILEHRREYKKVKDQNEVQKAKEYEAKITHEIHTVWKQREELETLRYLVINEKKKGPSKNTEAPKTYSTEAPKTYSTEVPKTYPRKDDLEDSVTGSSEEHGTWRFGRPLLNGIRKIVNFLKSPVKSIIKTTTGIDLGGGGSLSLFKRTLLAQFPGTRWCGDGNFLKDPRGGSIGLLLRVDKCCIKHHTCPEQILPESEKYGLKNTGLFTRSLCRCDHEFYNCLKDVGCIAADAIGVTYFNVLGPQCFEKDRPAVACAHKIREKCYNYKFDENGKPQYQWFDNMKY